MHHNICCVTTGRNTPYRNVVLLQAGHSSQDMSLLHAEDAAQELSLRQSRYAPQKVQVHTNAYKHFEIHTHVCQYIYIHTTRLKNNRTIMLRCSGQRFRLQPLRLDYPSSFNDN